MLSITPSGLKVGRKGVEPLPSGFSVQRYRPHKLSSLNDHAENWTPNSTVTVWCYNHLTTQPKTKSAVLETEALQLTPLSGRVHHLNDSLSKVWRVRDSNSCYRRERAVAYTTCLTRQSSGRGIWTLDLLVMSQASYRTALSRDNKLEWQDLNLRPLHPKCSVIPN